MSPEGTAAVPTPQPFRHRKKRQLCLHGRGFFMQVFLHERKTGPGSADGTGSRQNRQPAKPDGVTF
jgi:hypothetical protein